MGSFSLKYLLIIPLMLLAILFVFGLFYKIPCITKCVTEPPTKIMMTGCLEAVNQIYSSVRDKKCNSRYGKMQ